MKSLVRKRSIVKEYGMFGQEKIQQGQIFGKGVEKISITEGGRDNIGHERRYWKY